MIKNKMLVSSLVAMGLLYGCGSSYEAINLNPVNSGDSFTTRKTELSDDELKTWSHADLVTDTIPGMSVMRAYREILQNREGEKVIVGVVDSGVDIYHEDLKDVIWTNEDEVPDNGKDDDNNGYVDDVHGWNFLGEASDENLELVRIIKKGDDGSEDYRRAKAEYDEKYQEAKEGLMRYEQLLQIVNQFAPAIGESIGKENFTQEDLAAYNPQEEEMKQIKGMFSGLLNNADDVEDLKEKLEGGIEYFGDQLEYNLNKDFDGRVVVGDDPDDITDTGYGDNNVVGDVEHARHGTHVAGIIAATRGNDLGLDGVAQNVEIMAVRAVPNGDEYDKDIALGIRYAVDNGAKVINTSFGKYYSPHKEWVWDAIKYAESKDVLIVNAAGNEGLLLDETNVYPNDAENNSEEVADNFLTVGALHYAYGPEMIAGFSNYGKINVDVFAPGTKIWSTTPENEYEYLQGTSMAAPAVAGVAAIIRSLYPKLSASQVKHIIMQSGISVEGDVIVDGDPSNRQPFTDISSSGKMVNLYNAILLANKVARKEVQL
ncbi:S8 family peptidase [Robertkochia aurantiaca]|uniref:S8 family peptidase n=1 Tax=Robertkochia aurantiaca TaxID=2873700 RepID=UPI001CCA9272|nr:S8 family peptidase [Robertkochia sp. 3YJGBD-33]